MISSSTPATASTTQSDEPPRPVALVAGASRGLGLLVARELAARGCRTVLCARDGDELNRAVDLMRGWGYESRAIVCDVSDHLGVEAMVEEVEREVGELEIAVHVAGVIQVGPLVALTREHFQEAINVMTWGPINLALAVLPAMRARGHGHIATVTSIGGIVSVPHLLAYSTAKFAAVGFSQGLRSELAGTGVKVTTIVPGLMRTGSHLHAKFSGNPSAEYAWFAPGASLPLVSMDAERAAAKIVRGVMNGRSTLLLTPLAKVGARIAGVAPATTAALMGLAARLLPDAPTGKPAPVSVEGRHARTQLGSPLVEGLTTLGTRAAQRFNETQNH